MRLVERSALEIVHNTHLQTLGGLEETVECLLGDVNFALVHELQQRRHVLRRRRLQDDDALAICGRVLEQIGELFRAGCQD